LSVVKSIIGYSDDIELIFVELPKVKKALDELKGLQEQFIYFLKKTSDLFSYAKELEDIREALKIVNKARLNKEELGLK
jgi:hypothetical protein